MQSRSCEKGPMRIIYAKQAASFGTWEADGGGQGGREAAALRRRLMRLTQVKLAASFGTWRQMAEDMKREAEALRRGLMRLTQGRLAASFGT